MSYCNWGKVLSKFILRESRQEKGQSWFKVVLALLYKRTSKERRKGNPPTPKNLSLYTLRLPPSNHSSCSDVPSKYATMIRHTSTTTLFNTTTPHHPMSQHLKPLPYHNKLYRHPLTTSSHHSRISQGVRLSITLIPSIRCILFLSTLQSITRNLSRDNRAVCKYIVSLDSDVCIYVCIYVSI